MRFRFPAMKRSLPICSLLLCGSPLLAAGDDTCSQVNTPATSGYDFTESLSRWGSKGDYSVATTPHRVRSLTINTLPIFNVDNPDENRRLFRLANNLHFTTKPQVISQQLLFSSEEIVTEQQLAESERILRSRPYVGDARIRVLRDCNDAVDLEVVTHEVWTLTPDFNFKNLGGHSTLGLGIHDANFLGSGQLIDLHYRSNQERSSVGMSYRNPNISGSHLQFATDLSTNSDGHRYGFDTGRPFYSMRDHNAWNLHYESVEELLNQYNYGERISHLQHKGQTAAVTYSVAPDTSAYSIQRFSAGLEAEDHTLVAAPGLKVPSGFRDNLQLIYPFVQYELLQDAYERGFNISQIGRTEDLYVGRRLVASAGFAPGSEQQWILRGEYSDTLYRQPKALLQLHADWQGRWLQQQGAWEDAVMHASLDYSRGQSANRNLYLGLEAAHVINLRNGRQLELGGSNGLRGYDTHFLNGDSSVRFTAEQRYFSNYHWLQLFRVGVAAYYDVGRVFGNNDPGSQSTFQDIGVGLRLAPSRSQSGQIIHLDVAWPLDSVLPGGKHDLQFIAEVKKNF